MKLKDKIAQLEQAVAEIQALLTMDEDELEEIEMPYDKCLDFRACFVPEAWARPDLN